MAPEPSPHRSVDANATVYSGAMSVDSWPGTGSSPQIDSTRPVTPRTYRGQRWWLAASRHRRTATASPTAKRGFVAGGRRSADVITDSTNDAASAIGDHRRDGVGVVGERGAPAIEIVR